MKKIAIASLGILGLASASFSFANTTGTICNGIGGNCQLKQEARTEIKEGKTLYKTGAQALKDQEKANKEMLELNKKNFNANFDIARKYLIKPLTGDKRAIVNTVIKTKTTAMKTLQTETNALIRSGTVDRSGYITKATTILTTFRSGLLPYVKADQTTGFNTFIQEKINLMISNIGIRQANQTIKIQIGNKKVNFKTRLEQKKTDYKNLVQSLKKTK